jgi:hypothetical protein
MTSMVMRSPQHKLALDADEGHTMTIHPAAAASVAAPASSARPAAKPVVSEEAKEQLTGTEELGESVGTKFSAKA